MRATAMLILILSIFSAACTQAQRRNREGALSSVDEKVIERYIEHLEKQRYSHDWKPSIKNLAKTINDDPAIRYNW